jgi:hypothetical protein
VLPQRFELLRTRLRRRIPRLCHSSVCQSIVDDALTVCAVAGAAWRHCRIRRARTWRRSVGRSAVGYDGLIGVGSMGV